MRKTLAALAVAALTLAGCGTTGEDKATVSNTPAPSTSKTTSSATPTSETSSETSEPEAPAEQTESQAEAVPAEQPVVQAPTFVQCQMADGTALLSDGTTTYVDSCNESAGGPYLDLNGNPIGPSANGSSSEPTFDPDSADGYGPNQELPPFCDRFPDHETC